MVPKNAQLDIKGIASMAKSSMAESTRTALKNILLEDILNTPVIDQFKIIKDIAILEKKITDSIYAGSKEFYKPVTIKSISNYETPFRIQGIKASYVWNNIKPDDDNLPMINLDDRNAIDIAKTNLNLKNIDILQKYPKVYENAKRLLEDDLKREKSQQIFRGSIDAIAIPADTNVPSWVLDIIDYKEIVNDNISGFVFESVGLKRLDKPSINYTNILQL